MPSEKQIEAALEVFIQGYTGMLTKPLLRDMLTAAEQAEPASWKAADLIKATERNPGEPSPFSRPEEKYAAEPAPAARSGAVKALDRQIDNLLNQADHVELGIACKYPDVSEATRELIRLVREVAPAVEPAEPVVDVEPVAWLYDWVDDDGETQTEASTNRISSVNFKPTSNVRPLYARPPESRLREALEHIARGLSLTFTSSPTKMSGNEAQEIARDALAQEDGR